jgi:hypothetical protein
MAFIGNNLTISQYAPQIAYFSGNASTTAFTLPQAVVSAAQILVFVANVPQNPSSAYTVSGTTLTFTSAPPTGTNNIWVEYTSLQTNTVAPSVGTVGITQLSATGTASSTTYLRGDNTWAPITTGTVTRVNYVVIAGGGGAGGSFGGGGGAGGYLEGLATVASGSAITVTVGAGGTGATSNVAGVQGSDSVFGSITATGGGYGNKYTNSPTAPNGGNGGSGGGATGSYNINATGGTGISGQGYGGGRNGVYQGRGGNYYGGGGGGAASIGLNGDYVLPVITGNGHGGMGVEIPWMAGITGSTWFCGGGGAAANGTGGLGNMGIGFGVTTVAGAGSGAGSVATSYNSVSIYNGSANQGGGGGSAGANGSACNGGSGIVIVRYPDTYNAAASTTGSPTITVANGYRTYMFLSSGTITF